MDIVATTFFYKLFKRIHYGSIQKKRSRTRQEFLEFWGDLLTFRDSGRNQFELTLKRNGLKLVARTAVKL